MEEKIKQFIALKEKMGKIKSDLAELSNLTSQVESEIVDAMLEKDISKLTISGKTVYLRTLSNYKIPASPEQKYVLFDFIRKSRGEEILNYLLSINSRTLNAWIKEEVEADSNFKIPCLGEPSVHAKLGLRKA